MVALMDFQMVARMVARTVVSKGEIQVCAVVV